MDKKDPPKYGFDWGKYLTDQKGDAAPVQLFGHAQMSSNWVEIETGVKVEVLNSDCPVSSKVYWIAQIMKVAGYKALLRYEGFGDDDCCDFWCNLCTDDVHAVGWCATVGKPLVPPRTIQFKYSNWKSFLIERLTGSKTLPNDFDERVKQSMECSFKPKMRVEVMDKTQISRKRIGIIEDIVGGRLRLQYEDSDEPNDDFWCHCSSSLIHPIGWSEKVGHRILVANKDYKFAQGFKNSKPDMFVPVKSVKQCGFKVGMKLEAIDPLNLSSICVATIRKVLKNGYLMIGIDGSEAAGGTDWFCYHCSSPSIFPVGYCYSHSITLSIPNDHKNTFSWPEYLKHTKSEAAPAHLFLKEDIEHGFSKGMKLESVDLMDPRMICVATVSRVVGRLLRVHFDGWDAEYDQWLDSQSPDIFPMGWCELVKYNIQPPPNYRNKIEPSSENKRKAKTRTQSFAAKRKKKKLSDKKDSFNESRNEDPGEISEAEKPVKESETVDIDAENNSASKPLESSNNSVQDTTVDSTIDVQADSSVNLSEDGVFPLNDSTDASVDNAMDVESPNSSEDLPKVGEDLNLPKTSEDLNPPKIFDDLNPPKISDDLNPPNISEDLNPPKICEDLNPPKISEDLNPPNISEDLNPPKISEDLNPPNISEDLNPPQVGEDFDISMKSDDETVTKASEDGAAPKASEEAETSMVVETEEIQQDLELDVSQEIQLALSEDSSDILSTTEVQNTTTVESDTENIPPKEVNSNELVSSQDNSVSASEDAKVTQESSDLIAEGDSVSTAAEKPNSSDTVTNEETVVDNNIDP